MLTIEMDNFDLGQICRSGQCFRMDQIGDDRYRVIAGDKYLELTQERGIVNFFCPEEDFIFFWIRYFDLDCDYSEYINMINPRDKYLTAAGERGSGIRILQQDLWEMIISFLISQQNNITRIKKCIENISREFGVRKLCVSDCRGTGFGNGRTASGVQSGIQSKICAGHSQKSLFRRYFT